MLSFVHPSERLEVRHSGRGFGELIVELVKVERVKVILEWEERAIRTLETVWRVRIYERSFGFRKEYDTEALLTSFESQDGDRDTALLSAAAWVETRQAQMHDPHQLAALDNGSNV